MLFKGTVFFCHPLRRVMDETQRPVDISRYLKPPASQSVQNDQTTSNASSLVDIAASGELQRSLRAIKHGAANALTILMASQIEEDVNNSYKHGVSVSITEMSIAERVNRMDSSLPDIFLKWLRTSRLLEAEEARTLAKHLHGAEHDIEPINTGMSKCEMKKASFLFARFVKAVYLHIIVGNGHNKQFIPVTDEDVVKRISEVLESITPTSNYFCRRDPTMEDIPGGPTEELFKPPENSNTIDTPEITSEHVHEVGSKNSTSEQQDGAIDNGEDNMEEAPTQGESVETASMSGSDPESGSDSGFESESQDDSDSTIVSVASMKKDNRTPIGGDQLKHITKGNTSRSKYVKGPHPGEMNNSVIQNGWKTAKKAAKTTFDGIKVMFPNKPLSTPTPVL
jgi:hypothetical protein